ncbi:unnamed protein product [Parnassius apollo]|uniref:(apollo) hypothetical protein n=1 Tax=Parnassius apollo TaxID=110799 RepID=A0A8S3XQ99_PARAO|nr:unnamed protein product [Parnassius apollo]
MAPHTGSATPEQIDALLNFLDEHRDLARGRLRSLEGKVQAKSLWDELCNTLNSMGGCTKTVQQWQKTNESRPSTYSQGSQLQQQSLDLHVEVEEYADPSKESQQVYSSSTKNEISIEIDTQASQSACHRRIRSAAGSDVRSRLYQYEDGRAERERQ